ncbi:alpha/beta fold hydrolase [Beijerinckia sp. L45]|uniref:alpha/beta fold hydrolase n=1 Tax=Beijerinckia sp. L45 TaxID=1641855 RepID=UPI00131C3FDD|nr:alpha/beta hydrolase [Beijerinckia sp. L45]
MVLVVVFSLGWLLALLGALVLFTAITARSVERAVPPLGRFIDIDGDVIHYLDQGSGPAIVMIHGLGSQLRTFTYALLAAMSGNFRIILLDRPGSGYSRRARGASARLPAQARTIAGLITALQLERPLVVGHSLGGAVALALALDHPDKVGGLALIAPLTHPQDAPPDVMKGLAVQSPMLRRFIAWTFATPASMQAGPATLATVFGPHPVPDDFATTAGGLLSLRPSSFYGASSDLVAVSEDLPGMVARYPTLTLPVGVLMGTADGILDPITNAEALAKKVTGVDLELIENGGHMTPLTEPERSATFIERMARRVGAAQTSAPLHATAAGE